MLPTRTIAAVLVTAFFVGGALIWNYYRFQSALEKLHRAHLLVARHSDRIRYLDEVLTTSARLTAESGDLRYRERYQRHEPELRTLLESTLDGLASTDPARPVTAKTEQANRRLLAMEEEVFRLTEAGARGEALAVLNTPAYREQKRIYSNGITAALATLEAAQEDGFKRAHRYRVVMVGVAMFGGCIVLALWLVSIRAADRWAQERRHAADEIRRQEALSENLIASSVDGIFAFDREGRYTIWNPAMHRMSGIAKDEAVGRGAWEVASFFKEAAEESLIVETLKGCRVVARDRPYQLQGDGEPGFFDAHCSALHAASGEIVGGLCIVRDSTDRKRTEEALRESEQYCRASFDQARQIQDSLRALSREVWRGQEEERGRISRDLHDEIGQALTAVHVNLEVIKKSTAEGAEFRRRLTDTQVLVTQTMDTVHRFSRDLRPAMLDDLGLVPTLRSYAKSFAQRSGIRITVRVTRDLEKLDREGKILVYRVVQEALTNARRASTTGSSHRSR